MQQSKQIAHQDEENKTESAEKSLQKNERIQMIVNKSLTTTTQPNFAIKMKQQEKQSSCPMSNNKSNVQKPSQKNLVEIKAKKQISMPTTQTEKQYIQKQSNNESSENVPIIQREIRNEKNFVMIKNVRLSVVHDDITKQDTVAIVNAANGSLQLGAGVAGAIRKNGGPSIQKECDKYIEKNGQLDEGKTAVTKAGSLTNKYIIHAVGPVWIDGKHQEEQKLEDCVMNSLKDCKKYEIKSIAIPAISSGIFGFPKQLCAQILMHSAQKFLEQEINNGIENIRFTNFDKETVDIFDSEMKTFKESMNQIK